MVMLLSHWNFTLIRSYTSHVTPASRLFVLVPHSHHNLFLFLQHLYCTLSSVDSYPIASVQVHRGIAQPTTTAYQTRSPQSLVRCYHTNELPLLQTCERRAETS